MNCWKKISVALAAATVMGQASALMVDGVALPAGLTFDTITLFEGEDLSKAGNGNRLIDGVGESLLGIGIVNQILDASNNIVWSNGDNGRELTFVISDYTAEEFNLTTVGTTNIGQILFAGGNVRLYSQAVGTLDTAAVTQGAAVASASAGNLWLDLLASPLGGQTLLGNDTTLEVTSINTTGGNPFLASTNVTGSGLLDAVGGLAQIHFDTDTFGCVAGDGAPCPDSADLKFTSSGQLNAPGVGGPWGFRGTGEVQAFVVPAPGTLALAGLSLLALGAASRRRA